MLLRKRTFFVLGALLHFGVAQAHSGKVGDIIVDHPWSRAAVGSVGAVYFVIRNEGDADRLTAAASPVAETVELHEHAMRDGVMRMRPVSGGIGVEEDGFVAFEPGGYHVMLIGLKSPLEEGAPFPITLTFEQAGALTMEVEVLPADAAEHDDHGDHHHHDGDEHDGHGHHGGER